MMRKVIQGHLCNTATARKIAETAEIAVYRNKAGVCFGYNNARKDISLLTAEQVRALVAGDIVQVFPTAEPHGIRELRKAAGLTQRQLANAAGIDVRQLQRYENGKTAPESMALGTALRLAEVLSVDVKKLL